MKNKKKITKIVIACLISMFIINSSSMPVYAGKEDYLGRVVDGSELTDLFESEDTSTVLTRGNILNKGTSKISNGGIGKVIATGATVGNVVCDTLYLSLAIDIYDPPTDTWGTIKIFDISKDNASLFTKSYTYDVEGGNFYRVKGAHIAKLGDTIESVATTTEGIWID